MIANKDFVRRLRAVLKEKGISPYALSKTLDVAPATLQHILSERNLPRAQLLFGMCKTLNVSSDYLLGLKERE